MPMIPTRTTTLFVRTHDPTGHFFVCAETTTTKNEARHSQDASRFYVCYLYK
jgi:hypothetical protein